MNLKNNLPNPPVLLSIIIINYGKHPYSYLKNCLSSIYKNKENFSVETIVVDNSSSPQDINPLKRIYPKTKFKPLKNNSGYSKAINLGFSMAQGKYLLVLNNDIVFKDNTLTEIKKFIDSNVPFSIAGLQLLYEDGSVQFSKGKYPTISRIISGLFKPNFKKKWDTSNYDKIDQTNWVSGAAILIKNNGSDNEIKFDENYFLYYEEVDLCFNIKKAGGIILYAPSIQVYHLNPFHIKKNIDKNLYYEIRKSQMYFFYKNYGILSYLSLKFFTVAFVMLIIAVSFLGSFFNKQYSDIFNVYKYVLKKIITEKNNVIVK